MNSVHFFKSVAIYFLVAIVKDHVNNTIQIHSTQFSEHSSFCVQLYHSFLFDNLGEKIIIFYSHNYGMLDNVHCLTCT